MSLSEYELAMHALLTQADNIVVIMQQKDVDGFMLWGSSVCVDPRDPSKQQHSRERGHGRVTVSVE